MILVQQGDKSFPFKLSDYAADGFQFDTDILSNIHPPDRNQDDPACPVTFGTGFEPGKLKNDGGKPLYRRFVDEISGVISHPRALLPQLMDQYRRDIAPPSGRCVQRRGVDGQEFCGGKGHEDSLRRALATAKVDQRARTIKGGDYPAPIGEFMTDPQHTA